MLEESGGKLVYKKSKAAKLRPSEIDDEIDLKPQGDKFRITKKQYNDIIKNLEIESEIESEEDLKPAKRAKKAKVPKVKGKKVTTYKRGVFNPDVKLISETKMFSGKDNKPDWSIST
mmetsp:Transcript_21616/g.3539  ORF Transcript_21616/g.3539 Transcript_21616/m.3539 type:complete len:117 (+) Transcript_21616:178-528(+)